MKEVMIYLLLYHLFKGMFKIPFNFLKITGNLFFETFTKMFFADR